jgi:hypothetical protein
MHENDELGDRFDFVALVLYATIVGGLVVSVAWFWG